MTVLTLMISLKLAQTEREVCNFDYVGPCEGGQKQCHEWQTISQATGDVGVVKVRESKQTSHRASWEEERNTNTGDKIILVHFIVCLNK
jgi:hypothetical protein